MGPEEVLGRAQSELDRCDTANGRGILSCKVLLGDGVQVWQGIVVSTRHIAQRMGIRALSLQLEMNE